ncbi:MAG: GNAT family N-acetyltransferase [Candidatus Melainabacteria bacterium]|nr:GNAT family N-acetyltransferase [Candidatus Melainabacteria bacterium]
MVLQPPEIKTERLVLRMCRPEEALQVVAYLEANRFHLEEHGPTWVENYLNVANWQKQLLFNLSEFQADETLKLFLFQKHEPDTIIGTINFTSILRRAAQFCFLGYGLAHEHQGKGFMTEGLHAAIAHVFDEKNLHRISANYVPTNERSGRVLKKLGFQVEGYARDYLYLNGKWRDHILTSLVNDKWKDE